MKYSEVSAALSGLHCFASVGEHLSFAKAAADLYITPSAVSHRIKQLETRLGFSLFHRFTRRITFTPEGQRLFNSLRSSLGEIEREIRAIRNQEMQGNLVIACPPSFARIWLMSRLNDFSKAYPGVALHIRGHNNLVDFETANFDIAICYSDGQHPDLDATLFMSETFSPVCTREYADKYNLWDNPSGLGDCLLLHDASPWPNAQFFSEWNTWSVLAGVEDFDAKRGYSFDRCDLALKGARLGFGIAIGRYHLVCELLDSGELVTPFKEFHKSPLDYYLVCPHERVHSPRVEGFQRWIQQKANTGELCLPQATISSLN